MGLGERPVLDQEGDQAVGRADAETVVLGRQVLHGAGPGEVGEVLALLREVGPQPRQDRRGQSAVGRLAPRLEGLSRGGEGLGERGPT